MSKKVLITLTSDLFEHLEALKLYYGYKSRSAVVDKALYGLINKHVSNEIFHYYLACVRKELRDKEVTE